MPRLVILALVLLVSPLGCVPAAPPPATTKPPAELPPPAQETVAYVANDKSVHGYLCRPSNIGTYPGVLVIHDSMGLTDAIKDETFRLARYGFLALAVDLYRGQSPKTIADAKRLQGELPKERALGDLKAAVTYLSEREEVRAETLGVVGLGMGGSYAFEAALRDRRLRAAALCYCPLPSDPKPLKPLRASVFYLSAVQDKSVSQDAIATFCQAMQKAGKNVERVRAYGKCSYGFLDPAYWPIYGTPPEEDVEDAWELIERYFDKELM
jgi:carboxymethylenebutenolidase